MCIDTQPTLEPEKAQKRQTRALNRKDVANSTNLIVA